VYVEVSIWLDTGTDPAAMLITSNGWPTNNTPYATSLNMMAQDFYSYPYVLFGVTNEPENNFDGAQDVACATAMAKAVTSIRQGEDAAAAKAGDAQAKRHIIAVQGTRDWARDLTYYASAFKDPANPLNKTAYGQANLVYETHVYNNPSDFAGLLAPADTIPVIMGEFGPVPQSDGYNLASISDLNSLLDLAETKQVPFAAWTFHTYCPPNLIADKPNVSWTVFNTSINKWDYNSDTGPNYNYGVNQTIYPTDFGTFLIGRLANH
jgi:hypothetical protein